MLGGCAAQRAARDDAKCQGYGFVKGSLNYAQCRLMVDQARQERAVELINTGAMMMNQR